MDGSFHNSTAIFGPLMMKPKQELWPISCFFANLHRNASEKNKTKQNTLPKLILTRKFPSSILPAMVKARDSAINRKERQRQLCVNRSRWLKGQIGKARAKQKLLRLPFG